MADHMEVDSELAVAHHTVAPRDRVWAVLADGWTYAQWVVGNSRMRAVDPDWPAVGSTLHHSIGVWPLTLDDVTSVEENRPDEMLVLLAKGRPFGKARISLTLSDGAGSGCLIRMSEVPVGAPMGWLPERAALALAAPRNRECLRRLAALAERRRPADTE